MRFAHLREDLVGLVVIQGVAVIPSGFGFYHWLVNLPQLIQVFVIV